MFLLKGDVSTFILPKAGLFKVGRLTGEIVIKHSSISRKHAEIEVKNDGFAYIRDSNSKYLTKLNGRIVLLNEEKKLEDGDVVKFGGVTFTFQAGFDIVTCASGLKDKEEELVEIIKKLGGKYLKDWDTSCNYLTTNELFITMKVLHAIMDNKQIVTLAFWKTLLGNMGTNRVLPDASKYYPPFGESMINAKQVEYNPNRLGLFRGKTFAFWKKKHQVRMGEIVKKCGGDHILLTKTLTEAQLVEKMNGSIVMDPEDAGLQETFKNVISKYVGGGKRLIPIQEIVFSILQCSCDENCNPSFDRTKTVFAKETQANSSPRPIVTGTETQEYSGSFGTQSQVVPDSLADFDAPSTSRRPSEETQVWAKRIKLDPDVEIKKITCASEPDKSLETTRVPNFFKRPNEDQAQAAPKRVKVEPRSSMKPNPFALLTKKATMEKPDNHLSIVQMLFQKDPKVDKVTEKSIQDLFNPNKVVKLETDDTDSSIQQKTCQNKKSESRTINFSEIKHDVSEIKWIDANVKDEFEGSVRNGLDEEEKVWCEQFNDSVVIVPKPLVKMRAKGKAVPVHSESVAFSGVNFKKFRKQCVRKSEDVVACSNLVTNRSRLSVDYGFSDDEDDRNL